MLGYLLEGGLDGMHHHRDSPQSHFAWRQVRLYGFMAGPAGGEPPAAP